MLDPRQAKAIRRALELNTPASMERLNVGFYRVPSATSDQTYLVTVHGAEYVCDCTAGRFGNPCHHTAAVMIAELERSAGITVVGPTPKVRQAPRQASLR